MHSHLASPTAIAAFIRDIIDTAKKIAMIPEKYGNPTIVTILHPEEANPVINIFQSIGLPLYKTAEDCAKVMHGLAKCAKIRREPGVEN